MSEAGQESITGLAAVDSRTRAIEEQLLDLLIKVGKVTTTLYGESSDVEAEEAKQPYSFEGQFADVCKRCDEALTTIGKLHHEINRFNS